MFGIYKGHETRSDPIGRIVDMKVGLLGDAAYGASVFESKLYLADGPLILHVNCTNVVHRLDGAWKVVHHHPDQAPPEWTATIGNGPGRSRLERGAAGARWPPQREILCSPALPVRSSAGGAVRIVFRSRGCGAAGARRRRLRERRA